MLRIFATTLLLVASNTFMTFAWYYHLKRPAWPLLTANRLGHIGHGGPLTAPQLKVLQEAITLCVFGVFTLLVLRERPRPADYIAFALIMAAVCVSMFGGGAISAGQRPAAP